MQTSPNNWLLVEDSCVRRYVVSAWTLKAFDTEVMYSRCVRSGTEHNLISGSTLDQTYRKNGDGTLDFDSCRRVEDDWENNQ